MNKEDAIYTTDSDYVHERMEDKIRSILDPHVEDELYKLSASPEHFKELKRRYYATGEGEELLYERLKDFPGLMDQNDEMKQYRSDASDSDEQEKRA